MDWLQFIDGMVGHLAWPIVVGVLLFMLRKQVIGLAVRLKELSLPGGMKATFEKELEVGRSIVEKLPDQVAPQVAPPVTDEENKLLRVAIHSPEGAIVLAYIELEKVLKDTARKLHKSTNVLNHGGLVEQLIQLKLLDPEAFALFQSLRRARNSAAHGSGEQELTTAEAIEYIHQVDFMVGLLQQANSQL